jgi:hypothetical protein
MTTELLSKLPEYILSRTILRMNIASQRRRYQLALVLAFVVVAVAFVAFHGGAYFRAVTLVRIQNPQNPGTLARVTAVPLDEELTTVPTPSGPIRAIVRPQGHAPRTRHRHRAWRASSWNR